VDVIERVYEGAGIELLDEFSVHSLEQFIWEGGVASKLQISREIQNAGGGYLSTLHYQTETNWDLGCTISSNGTTHKHNQFESQHVHIVGKDGKATEFFMGIQTATNHTSEEQLHGWQLSIEGLFELSNTCGISTDADHHDFWSALKGMHTDHVEDQKKLVQLVQELKKKCEREKRGEAYLAKDVVAVLPRMVKAGAWAVERAEGAEAWYSLTEEEQTEFNKEEWRILCLETG
jgi:hypothetical protein